MADADHRYAPADLAAAVEVANHVYTGELTRSPEVLRLAGQIAKLLNKAALGKQAICALVGILADHSLQSPSPRTSILVVEIVLARWVETKLAEELAGQSEKVH